MEREAARQAELAQGRQALQENQVRVDALKARADAMIADYRARYGS